MFVFRSSGTYPRWIGEARLPRKYPLVKKSMPLLCLCFSQLNLSGLQQLNGKFEAFARQPAKSFCSVMMTLPRSGSTLHVVQQNPVIAFALADQNWRRKTLNCGSFPRERRCVAGFICFGFTHASRVVASAMVRSAFLTRRGSLNRSFVFPLRLSAIRMHGSATNCSLTEGLKVGCCRHVQ